MSQENPRADEKTAGLVAAQFFLVANQRDMRQIAAPAGAAFRVFEPGCETWFTPGENIFALADEPKDRFRPLRRTLVHIAVDALANPAPVDALEVDYAVTIVKRYGAYRLHYAPTEESQDALQAHGFHPNFQRVFVGPASAFAPEQLEMTILDAEILKRVPFPPHHAAARADTARWAVAKGAEAGVGVRFADNWEKPAQLVEAFGGAAASAEHPLVMAQALPANLPPPPGARKPG